MPSNTSDLAYMCWREASSSVNALRQSPVAGKLYSWLGWVCCTHMHTHAHMHMPHREICIENPMAGPSGMNISLLSAYLVETGMMPW